jgi:hypothetical protein
MCMNHEFGPLWVDSKAVDPSEPYLYDFTSLTLEGSGK